MGLKFIAIVNSIQAPKHYFLRLLLLFSYAFQILFAHH